ncbi:FecR domain-containing protein [Pedobacter sp. ASV1-7]|uniref:FecR family protein n=1 Tax=Pedobacter sp. ASV1-7 TaxID=3145237 RepID=UPI0032E8EB3C
MDRLKAQELINKYLEGKATHEEKLLLEHWYNHEIDQAETMPGQVDFDAIEQKLLGRLPVHQVKTTRLYYRIAGVAAVLLIITGLYLFIYQVHEPVKQIVTKTSVHIPPGSNKAVLTLANGERVLLNDAENGKLAQQSGNSIIKEADGKLVYSADINKAGSLVYNKIETPKGGQYQLRLPDGTKVWLNAASSLKFPATFNGVGQRKVELNGEAYFEVSKNKDKPFIVSTEKQEIEVLGTHFNVNSYQDESETKTTLLEGSVNVMRRGSTKGTILSPGQQLVVSNAGTLLHIKIANIDEAMAWKDGKFIFNDQNLQTIMRQISRWYDVDVEYKGNRTANKVFGGTISRFESLEQALEILELTGSVHFVVEGRRVIVMN